MTPAEMDRLCHGLVSKSDKIRALAEAGVAKGDIARHLDIRYQFVYNVLKRETPEDPRASAVTHAAPASGTVNDKDDQPLTIADAKRRLARTLGVDPSSIRITIEG